MLAKSYRHAHRQIRPRQAAARYCLRAPAWMLDFVSGASANAIANSRERLPDQSRFASSFHWAPATPPRSSHALWRRSCRSHWGSRSSSNPSPGQPERSAQRSVARAPADGYTLLAATDGVMAALPSFQADRAIQPHPRFRADRADGWNPVRVDRAPFAFGPSSVHQLIDMAKAEPGKIDFSTGGNGSAQQLVMAMFMTATGDASSPMSHTRAHRRPRWTWCPDRFRSRSPACRSSRNSSRTVGCGGWRSQAINAWLRCRTSRRSKSKAFPCSLRHGSGCSLHPVHRARSLRDSAKRRSRRFGRPDVTDTARRAWV